MTERTTPYQPGLHSDLWEPLFPTHDYPVHFAEACVMLWQRSGEAMFRDAARSWMEQLRRDTPRLGGRLGYAEHYGRWLGFLSRAGEVFADPTYREQAEKLTAEALDQLWAGPMFRTHTGEDRCDAIDGPGILAAGLLERCGNHRRLLYCLPAAGGQQ